MSATAPTATGGAAAERLGIRAHSDGPVVPVQTRSERFRSTDPAEFPDVVGREVNCFS